jgi:uncharacterized flavoprotein (TIGR03862 family)
MAAEVLAAGGAQVTVYDRMPAAGRKFLLAGRGGLNLTHSEPLERFLRRYRPAAPALLDAIRSLPPGDVRAWCEALGQETFIGSSGRIFPKSLKASPLLRAWLRRLDALGVVFARRHRWTGWEDGSLSFETPGGVVRVQADATVLALGGASWPRLGSDGGWVEAVTSAGIDVLPLRPANCGLTVDWSAKFRERFAGEPLKRIGLSFPGQAVRGEAIVSQTGLEGGAVYALVGAIRDAIEDGFDSGLTVDLRPDMVHGALAERLSTPRGKQSLSNHLRKAAALAPVAIGLLQESHLEAPTRLSDLSPAALASLIKRVPVRVTGLAPIDRAISTAGGIALDEIDPQFMLRRKPGIFVAGEMLDWEAPTGGYLLQACFATGVAAGRGALTWVNRPAD